MQKNVRNSVHTNKTRHHLITSAASANGIARALAAGEKLTEVGPTIACQFRYDASKAKGMPVELASSSRFHSDLLIFA